MTRLDAFEANLLSQVKIVDDLQHEIEALKVIMQTHAEALRRMERDIEAIRANIGGWRPK